MQKHQDPTCLSETMAFVWVSLVTSVMPGIKAETTAIQAQDDLLTVLLQLRANDVDLEKDVASLQVSMTTRKKEMMCKMKPGMSKAQKTKAFSSLLPSIRKMKTLQSQQKVNCNRINLVVKQLEAFESGKFQQSIVKTLKQSVMAMKQIGIGTKADEIDEMMGDLDDNFLASNDVNEALSGHNMTSMNVDEDDLMNEFDEWLLSEELDQDQEHDISPVLLVPMTVAEKTVAEKTEAEKTVTETTTPVPVYSMHTYEMSEMSQMAS
jgi:hypothetical protein